jgi:acyl carrier protein
MVSLDHVIGRALPLSALCAEQGVFLPPVSATEEAVAKIWAMLFEVDVGSISRDSNFLAMGGHSLLLMLMISAMSSELGVELPFKDVFEAINLSQVAVMVDAARSLTVHLTIDDKTLEETEW